MAINDVASLNQLVTTAYDLLAHKPLRSKLLFDQITFVRSTNQTHNGAKVQFPFIGEIGENVTPLHEQNDAAATALSSSYVEIEMREHGDRAGTTRLLRGTSMIALDPIVAERIGRAAGASYDRLIELALRNGSNVKDITSDTTKTMTSSLVREQQTVLFARDVEPIAGESYVLFAHPDVLLDLREEDDAAGLRTFQNAQPAQHQNVLRGVITQYEGFSIIPTNRVGTSGSGAAKVYNSYALGREAIGKAVPKAPGFSEYPTIYPGPVVDAWARKREMVWYWLGGFGVFRDEALQVIKTRAGING